MKLFEVHCDVKKCIFEDMIYRKGINPIYPNNVEKLCMICPKMCLSYDGDSFEFINR